MQQLELAPCEVEAGAADEGLKLIGPDLQLTDHQRSGLDAATAPAAADDRLDPGDHLLRVAGLAHPVVGPQPQTPDTLGDAGRTRADDHGQVGQHPAYALQIGPAVLAKNRGVEDDRTQLHRHQLLGRGGAGEMAVLPAGRLDPLGEHANEAAVVVYDREPDGAARWFG